MRLVRLPAGFVENLNEELRTIEHINDDSGKMEIAEKTSIERISHSNSHVSNPGQSTFETSIEV